MSFCFCLCKSTTHFTFIIKFQLFTVKQLQTHTRTLTCHYLFILPLANLMLIYQSHLGAFQLYSFLLFSINCKIFLNSSLSYFSLLHQQYQSDYRPSLLKASFKHTNVKFTVNISFYYVMSISNFLGLCCEGICDRLQYILLYR